MSNDACKPRHWSTKIERSVSVVAPAAPLVAVTAFVLSGDEPDFQVDDVLAIEVRLVDHYSTAMVSAWAPDEAPTHEGMEKNGWLFSHRDVERVPLTASQYDEESWLILDPEREDEESSFSGFAVGPASQVAELKKSAARGAARKLKDYMERNAKRGGQPCG